MAVGIQLARKSVTLHILPVVEMSVVVFVNLVDARMNDESLPYRYALAVAVATEATAQLMLTIGRQCVEHYGLLLDLHLADDDQLCR